MDERFDSQKVLRAAEVVRLHGSEHAGDNGQAEVKYRGFTLVQSPDEYTIQLRWRSSELHVFFHNRFRFDGGSRREFDAMMDAIESLLREDDRELSAAQ